MERDIIIIDEEACIGCGACVGGCHEGALQMIDGKARLIGDLLCDGLGACIGHCPTDALKIVRREAEPYDEVKVMDGLVTKGAATIEAHLKHLRDHKQIEFYNQGIEYLKGHQIAIPGGLDLIHEKPVFAGCPGSMARQMEKGGEQPVGSLASALTHWPIQLHLVMPQSPHFKGQHLLLAADCTAFALGSFHSALLDGKTLSIACPKLDDAEGYVEKLVSFIDDAQISELTVVTMEVPCCGGLWALAQEAAQRAVRKIPVNREIVNIDGSVR